MERKIKIKSLSEAQSLFGPNDENIKSIEKEFKVKLTLRGEYLKLAGSLNNIGKATDFICKRNRNTGNYSCCPVGPLSTHEKYP